MKVHLSRITSEGVHHSLRILAADLPRLAEEMGPLEGPVAGVIEANLSLKTIDTAIQITGTVSTELELPCTRCLAPVSFRHKEEVTAVQAPVEELRRMEQDIQLAPTDLDIDYFAGNEVDLTDIIEEQVLLMLPQTIYCREECLGLCPQCGADLNDAPCGCEPDRSDHPFAAMKAFLSEPLG